MSDTSTNARRTASIAPCVRYRDERAAMKWLEEAFGFAEHAVHENEDGSVAHAELRLGSGILMIGSGPDTDEPFSLYVTVEDVDAHHARAVAAGAEIVRPLRDTDYGSREYGARDPDGHVWYFGTYDPAANPEG
ncbi:MAG: VOC family protein [Gemmatimonadota bacterium]